MESLLVRALESKLKYWLRSFSREQFKLQGRSVLLYNLDLNGDVLHAAIGLPPTLRVAQARVGRFELKLPSITYVNSEPIVVEIDSLDLVLVETSSAERDAATTGSQPITPGKTSTGYSFADKIADGMTIVVGTVNLMLETRGGSGREGAAWTPPLASVTIRRLLLYTTNENWKVVNLKEARHSLPNEMSIYVFKKLEWESLSVDLLPHPDMFADETLADTDTDTDDNRDNVGAKRRFFGGERFLDTISGRAHITMHRTEQNNPLGLEVQILIAEALCPALSEPGLRALLRFMTGVYVCLNRGDVDAIARQSDEVAGRTIVKVTVDHIFVCIKDADIQLELLIQSLNYIRASKNEEDCTRAMSRLELGYLFLRDTHSNPSCTLVQPSLRTAANDQPPVPSFASEKFWPRIYPLDFDLVTRDAPPMLCIYSSQTTPAPTAPHLASQLVVQCQPVTINLQEESCTLIASFLADGVVVERGLVRPDTSLNAIYLSLKEVDLTVPLKSGSCETESLESFTGARLHVEGFMIAQSPFLSFKLLNLDEDPSCFAFWKGQPVDSSQQRWVVRATQLSIALERGSCDDCARDPGEWSAGLWHCVIIADPCVEAAMVTADGKALVTIPPPGGIVRLGVSCKTYVSNTSSEQLPFVLKMYSYVGKVGRSLLRVSKGLETSSATVKKKNTHKSQNLKGVVSPGGLAKMVPDDTAAIVRLGVLELKLLECVPGQVAVEGPPLLQIWSRGINLKASHRMLGGAAIFSSAITCQEVRVECVETELHGSKLLGRQTSSLATQFGEPVREFAGHIKKEDTVHQVGDERQISEGPRKIPNMRAVLWIGDEKGSMSQSHFSANGHVKHKKPPFLDVSVVHMTPLRMEDFDCHQLKVTAKVAGVRLGGGMVYTEALLHRFGVLGPDGGPGEEVAKVLEILSSGPVAGLLRPSPGVVSASKRDVNGVWDMGIPDDVDIDLQLQDWLFALEGSDDTSTVLGKSFLTRQQRCWHSTFRCLRVIAIGRNNKKQDSTGFTDVTSSNSHVQEITLQVEGLQALKPQLLAGEGVTLDKSCIALQGEEVTTGRTVVGTSNDSQLEPQERSLRPVNLHVTSKNGLDLAANLIEGCKGHGNGESDQHWVVESFKVAVQEPMELMATKAEVECLVQTGKRELESATRVAVGILKLLQLHGPFGQSAIDQLNSIGSGSLQKFLNSEDARSLFGTTGSSKSLSSLRRHDGQTVRGVQPTLAALQRAIRQSRELLVDLESSLCDSRVRGEGGRQVFHQLSTTGASKDVSLISEQLLKMEGLLSSLRSDLQ